MEEILAKLISYPTVTRDREANHEALAYVSNFLQDRGMHLYHKDSNGFGALVATTQKTKTPKVMLYAHLDVVAAPEYLFKLEKRDGKYFGRGVYDMKVALAVYMQLVDALRDNLDEYDFGILVVTDEELGGKDNQCSIMELYDEGYKGEMYVIPDGGEDWQLQVFEKGYLHYTLEAHGTTAHGSRPWLGDNAVVRLMHMLIELASHFTDPGTNTDTLNIGKISGGEVANQVPHYAAADIDMRLNSLESATTLPALINSVAKKYNVVPTRRIMIEPTEGTLDDPYLAAFAKSIEKVTGIVNKGFRSQAGSDARYLIAKGIPCAVTYPIGGGHHSNSEWLDEEAFFHFYDIIADYIEKMTHGVKVATPVGAVKTTAR